ncbi:hypothetical protein ACIQCM_09210 [Pseudarthrobacter sp. NPDC092439]|uniref:hypothetical protein n=1 Tax=unclassified Pseudarthrobacter TaxID=2647000 RepID=UPI0037F982D4
MSSKITATADAAEDRPIRTPQNENNLATSVMLFVVCIVLFLGAIYSLSFLTLDNSWPMAICLGLFALAFWVPLTITGRSDSAGEH